MGKPEASDQNRELDSNVREIERNRIGCRQGGKKSTRLLLHNLAMEHGQSVVMISDAILNALLAHRGWPGQARRTVPEICYLVKAGDPLS